MIKEDLKHKRDLNQTPEYELKINLKISDGRFFPECKRERLCFSIYFENERSSVFSNNL